MRSSPSRPFSPASWLPGAHAQTIGGRFARSGRDIWFRRVRLDTPDGDFLDLEYAVDRAHPVDEGAPLILLLHGLEGSAHSSYAAELARALAGRGLRMVGLNFRSCGGRLNRTLRFYHSGETGDLSQVVAWLRATEAGVPLGAVGFSLGGNVLLKYLGERGDDAGLEAAVGISVPYDLEAGARLMSRGAGRLYTGFFLRSLRRKVRAKEADLAARCDVSAALRARTFPQFDDAVTAPLHGFRDATDYYRRASAGGYLAGIRVPTLLIHAGDDPIAPASGIPRGPVAENPCLSMAFTPRGGHVGWVEGTPWRPRFWAEETAAQWLGTTVRCET